jgi:signal transduction histidine kinase
VDLQPPAVTMPRAGALARVSIEHKLPLIFGSVLLAVIFAVTASAVEEMRRAALHAASERSAGLTQQFATLLQQSSAQLRAQTAATAAKPEIAHFIHSRDEPARAAALQALEYHGANPEQVLATELRDEHGDIVLSTRVDTSVRDPLAPSERARLAAVDSVTIGGVRRIGGVSAYSVVAPVPGATGSHLVLWRRMTGTRQGRQALKRLIGSEATLYVGSRDGSYVTDLEQDITSVAVNRRAFSTPQIEMRPAAGAPHDMRYLVSWAVVPRTPWIVGVDIPLEGVLAPVNAFIRRVVVLALAALAVGLVAAWVTSRRLTGPLRQLADAAEAISNGDYSRTVTITRSDELGRLGRGFNVMAAEVAQSRQGLEAMVEERTRTLNDTLQQLHDAQESLVRREKLVMLGQLAGGVGHELRNPLGVMTNAIYYLKTVLGTAPSNVQEYLEILQQQITLSEKIVSDLLDFARLKPPMRLPASLAEVASDQLRRLGSRAGVIVSTELPADLPAVLVDRGQIGQIIFNLLTNAMQAMDHAGRITVRAHADQSMVHCDIRDTGPGVPSENSEKIFEPLFTTKARGIGLGLAVSRTLARANQGDLTLRTAGGAGADFRLSLPIAGTS